MTTTYINRRQTRDGAWSVTEVGDDGLSVTVHLLSKNDQTAGLPTPYDPRCAMCWLGHAHSQLVHKNSIARYVEGTW